MAKARWRSQPAGTPGAGGGGAWGMGQTQGAFKRSFPYPTPVLLPGKSHGRRSLVGCSPWGRWELDTTERLHFHFSLSCTGEGNGNPLQCSCLEKEMATHSSVLAWRIPGMGEPGGLPSMGSHRVGHDWSDLAVACVYGFATVHTCECLHVLIWERNSPGPGKVVAEIAYSGTHEHWRFLYAWEILVHGLNQIHRERFWVSNIHQIIKWGITESSLTIIVEGKSQNNGIMNDLMAVLISSTW